MTLSEDTLFQGFSGPKEPFHEASLHLVAVQYARAVLEVFVGSSAAKLKPYVRSTIAPFCGLLESAQIRLTRSRGV